MRDYIQVPCREQYKDIMEFYSTLFHEMIHSTGHRDRLGRLDCGTKIAGFGSEEYSKEELIAEIGSAFLMNHIGAIFPVAVRMVYQVAHAVKIPVVGMGGVSSAEDVIEMMMAGATAVEVGAANLINPYAARDIIADLPRVMEQYRIESLESIIGEVK